MIPLIDADILCYEIGFAAEVAWKGINKGDVSEETSPPPWSLVAHLLEDRLEGILARIALDVGEEVEDPEFYMTGKENFRNVIAKVKPYKGTRKGSKPWHYNNIKAHLLGVYRAKIVEGFEADDLIAMVHCNPNIDTIVVSRDKDLRQLPGWSYSWELGKQPAFGPVKISKAGSIRLSKNNTKIEGTGLAFFYSQCLTGDTVDNIPGLPGCGPVAAIRLLNDLSSAEQLSVVCSEYMLQYADEDRTWQQQLTEQGQLLWMTRMADINGSPVLWEIGMEE